MRHEFPVGTKYTDRKGRNCEVIDIHKTYNLAGELVKIRHVVSYTFLGQIVIDSDVVHATIARACANQTVSAR